MHSYEAFWWSKCFESKWFETGLSYIYMGIRMLREQSKCLTPEAEEAHCVEPAWSAHLLAWDNDRFAVCSCCEYCIFDKIFIDKFKLNLSYSRGHNYKTFCVGFQFWEKYEPYLFFCLFIEWTQRLRLFFIINISTNFHNQKLSSFLCRTCLMVKNNSGPWLSTAHSKCILVPQSNGVSTKSFSNKFIRNICFQKNGSLMCTLP